MGKTWINPYVLGNRLIYQVSIHNRFNTYNIIRYSIYIHYIHATRLPSICHGDPTSIPGYNFKTESSKRASYLTAMQLLAKINEDGTDLSLETWLDSAFILPFKVVQYCNIYVI